VESRSDVTFQPSAVSTGTGTLPWAFAAGVPAPKGLFAKLAKILGTVGRVEKRGHNDFHKYDYATESDIVDEIRPKLAEANVFLFTSVAKCDVQEYVKDNGKKSRIARVTTKHTFADGDTGETWEVQGVGEGEDVGDKAVYKAITGAEKYALTKNFMISTGEDPEKDDGKGQALAETYVMKPVKTPAQVQAVARVNEMERFIQDGPGSADEVAQPPPPPPARPAPKKAVALPPGTKFVTGKVTAVSVKPGNTKGKAWTRYGVKIGDNFFSTFSAGFGEDAIGAKNSGGSVTVAYTTGEYQGKPQYDIVDLVPAEPAPEQSEQLF